MLGLQLYTVRKKITDSSSAAYVLQKVRDMGYEAVQLAGDNEMLALTADAAKKAGLAVFGLLTSINVCEEKGEELFAIARLCGATDIGIGSGIKTETEAYEYIARVNAFAKTAKENGFSFSYHNHSNEFIRGESGRTLMSILLDGFDKDLVDLMPDIYWLQHGGVDIRDFLEKTAGRAKLLHLKDMKRTVDGVTYAELGMGNINLPGVVETAKSVGIDRFIVEQDSCDGDPLVSAQISFEYIKRYINL
ncbi:MAG: sugar phosphate isomerase/epimerase [Ruminococcaceae bacterium]|nr:sugar phosphate isomerase/epimerase [Oscillospiraceae bacterium]